MAQVVYSPRALQNIERAFEHLLLENPETAMAAVLAIRSAIDNLAAHPLVGRRIEGEARELVISFGATGHIAVYRLLVRQDLVRVLALRHQRQIGYLP